MLSANELLKPKYREGLEMRQLKNGNKNFRGTQLGMERVGTNYSRIGSLKRSIKPKIISPACY